MLPSAAPPPASPRAPLTRIARALRSNRVGRSLRPRWRQLSQFVLPNLCALCSTLSHETLCAACDAAYWNEPRLRCVVCAMPLAGAGRAAARGYRCGECVEAPPPFDATLTLADYRAPLDLLIRELKFRAQLALAGEFARRLSVLAANALDPSGPLDPIDIVAPVPLSRARLVERGHNQAWQIAKPLAEALRVPADATLVQRVVDTAPQSRLDRQTRRHNVDRAFALTRPVRGLHVAVVDDVMTSGATLDALARTLKAAGARRVTNFVALRTPKN